MKRINYPEFQTARLRLRELTTQDSAGLFLLFSNPQITQYMDIDPLQNEEEAREIIEFHAEDSGCRWGLFDKSTDKLIGTCGYHRWQQTIRTAEIGYDLSPDYWGQGVMKEALESIIQFGFETMGLTIIEAEVEKENSRSINLLKKLGFYPDMSRESDLEWFLLFNS